MCGENDRLYFSMGTERGHTGSHNFLSQVRLYGQTSCCNLKNTFAFDNHSIQDQKPAVDLWRLNFCNSNTHWKLTWSNTGIVTPLDCGLKICLFETSWNLSLFFFFFQALQTSCSARFSLNNTQNSGAIEKPSLDKKKGSDPSAKLKSRRVNGWFELFLTFLVCWVKACWKEVKYNARSTTGVRFPSCLHFSFVSFFACSSCSIKIWIFHDAAYINVWVLLKANESGGETKVK